MTIQITGTGPARKIYLKSQRSRAPSPFQAFQDGLGSATFNDEITALFVSIGSERMLLSKLTEGYNSSFRRSYNQSPVSERELARAVKKLPAFQASSKYEINLM